MAEHTAPITAAVPPYTVRHVDGVMHLTLNAKAEPQPAALRVTAPLDPDLV